MDEKLSDLWARIPEMPVGDAIAPLILAAIVLSFVLSIVTGWVRWMFRSDGPEAKRGKASKMAGVR